MVVLVFGFASHFYKISHPTFRLLNLVISIVGNHLCDVRVFKSETSGKHTNQIPKEIGNNYKYSSHVESPESSKLTLLIFHSF